MTGGYGYDRRILQGLTDLGWQVAVRELAASFPFPDAGALKETQHVLAQLPARSLVIVDGLAYGAMPEIAAAHASRLRLVALVHHPLALEAGLAASAAAQLRKSERRALAVAAQVVVTSGTTAHGLSAYDVPAERITVIEPGTDQPATRRVPRSDSEVTELLCVAALVPRKGHALLLEALAGLADRKWRLTCVGSEARDPATAARVRALVQAYGLAERVVFTGELEGAALAQRYASADVFVLATLHEGYGMVLAEALAHGLPIVSTTAGAVPDTVPADAGLLVAPGDVPALHAALARIIDEPAARVRLAAGAARAAPRLPSWSAASARLSALLEHVAAR